MMNDPTQTNKEQATLEQKIVYGIAKEAIAEQCRARRWGIFFKLFLILYVSIFAIAYFSDGWNTVLTNEQHTALIDISGIISADSQANADYISSGLRAAFEHKNTAGIILRINSPGGSPVQAGYINDEIYRLRAKYPTIPFYSVITDIGASGGYYIAVAADKIYVDKASIVGSIGVTLSSFGFVDGMEKLGIERRLLHAGTNKGLLDPFLPLQIDETEHVEIMLANIHQQFIDAVKKGRGDRLIDDKIIFSGLIWTGEQSIELGLVDAIGSTGHVAREVIGTEHIVDFTKKESLESFLEQFSTQMSIKLAQILSTTLNTFKIR